MWKSVCCKRGLHRGRIGSRFGPSWLRVVPLCLRCKMRNGAEIRSIISSWLGSRLRDCIRAPEADRRSLIRRVSFDLIGLPPSAQEVEEFVNDSSPDAYEKVVDRLLASPHYGEHRARYWLDAARYGDTHGIHIDNYREIWAYRDWVIDAFNRNEPFDQFTIDQIAGDLRAHATLEQQIATGFNRCNITTSEGGSIPDEVAAMYAKDRVETTSTVWLGLTAGCAVCHDHKFDPITQKEFYEFTAFFRNTTQNPLDGNVKDTPPNVVVPNPNDRPQWDKLTNELTDLQARRRKLQAEAGNAFAAWMNGPGAKSLEQPFDPKDEQAVVPLIEGKGSQITAWVNGQSHALSLSDGLKWQAGPAQAKSKALDLGPRPHSRWLTPVTSTPTNRFQSEPGFSCPGRREAMSSPANLTKKPGRARVGWELELDNRVPAFRMIGKTADDRLEVKAINTFRLKGGTWNHIFVTYDGGRHRNSLTLYINGKLLLGEETDVKSLNGSIRNFGPMRLGTDGKRDFHGGAIRDFRIYRRDLTRKKFPSYRSGVALRGARCRGRRETLRP